MRNQPGCTVVKWTEKGRKTQNFLQLNKEKENGRNKNEKRRKWFVCQDIGMKRGVNGYHFTPLRGLQSSLKRHTTYAPCEESVSCHIKINGWGTLAHLMCVPNLKFKKTWEFELRNWPLRTWRYLNLVIFLAPLPIGPARLTPPSWKLTHLETGSILGGFCYGEFLEWAKGA